jgi:hypothetical protein
MSARTSVAVAAAAAVVLGGGVLIASNMGFKLNFTFLGPGGASAGKTITSLPYNRQVGIDRANHLRTDIINSGGTGVTIARLITSSNTYQTYSGASTLQDFDLAAGEAYLVQLTNSPSLQYIIVGSHQPGQAITFPGPGGASAGRKLYAPPYHTTNTDASGLRNEILNLASPVGGVVSVARLITSSNTYQTYSGASTLQNFLLQPGVGYLVQVSVTKTLTPAHY